MTEDCFYCLFDTVLGSCGVAWSTTGLTRLQLPEANRARTERRLKNTSAASSPGNPPPTVRQGMEGIARYLAGERVDFSSIPLDLTGVVAFNRKVYDAARSIGWGSTASYGELARLAGCSGEAREVGQALARNPIAIIIPCHRILAKGNRIGGFSAYGGTLTKERLLALEGVDLQGEAPLLPGLLPARR
jgi:methylated-DNA-[protein]-cysteine S-methyltransferase